MDPDNVLQGVNVVSITVSKNLIWAKFHVISNFMFHLNIWGESKYNKNWNDFEKFKEFQKPK